MNFAFLLRVPGLAVRRFAAEWREEVRWRRGGRRGGDFLRVFYGYDPLPARDGIVSGGLVKCLDLAEAFPNTPSAPNLLYLVSSALPVRFREMVRACRRHGGRFVLNQNGVAYPGWYPGDWRAANRPLAALHRQADFVIYQSAFCRTSAERFLGKRPGASCILHNPVDVRTFSPAPSRSAPSGPILLLAGSHHFAYRVETAVETLARLAREMPGVRLHVAGRCLWKGNEAASVRALRAYAAERRVGDRLVVSGPYSQQEAPEIFRRADILLHTKYNDPCPRLVVEAMACGLPVVYSATGGVPELVPDTAGVGVPGPLDYEQTHPPDPERLAEGVRRILADYPRFSRAAREAAISRFDRETWIERHREIFETLLRNSGCR